MGDEAAPAGASAVRLDGVHHITAVTADVRRNLTFYTGVLGLRMIAKTVNQDDPGIYHLFYGDELARPGADLTFFEYPGALAGRAGAGMIHRVLWRVGHREALDFWAQRLAAQEIDVARTDAGLRFSDPEGLDHELVLRGAADAPLSAEHPDVPAEMALQGFEGVRAYSADPERTALLLEDLMLAAPIGDGAWELRGEGRRGVFALDPAPSEPARPGSGTVHHVAWCTTDAQQPRWLEALAEAGVPNTGIIDRHYFHSVYFREPGGVLFELATAEPGFAVDGPVEELGRTVILPPWLESQRATVEARLTPLPDPRAGWATPR